MPKNDVVYKIDNQKSRSSALVISGGGSSTGGTGGSVDTSAFLRRDGTVEMLGNLNMGGFSITNVSLVDGIDVPAHVGNPNAHHTRAHDYNSTTDHTGLLLWDNIDFGASELLDIRTRPHSALTNIGPNDHHNQVHNITGSDHTVTGVIYDVVGLTANNTLGLLRPESVPGAAIKLVRTDANGEITIKRLNGTDYVKSAAYLQAATYVQAGSYVSAVTYVDSPILQQAGNISINAGINIYLNPTNYIAVGANKSIRTDSFVSGFAGGGWQIDQNISAPGTNAEFDNLTIRGRMRVYELIIQQIRATNGSIFVSSASKAKTVTLVSGDTYTITSEDYHGFLLNDMIRAQKFTTAGGGGSIIRCDMRVTGVTDLYTYTAVRENASDIPKVGYDFVRIGNTSDATRRGALYLSSDDSNAPFIDVVNGVDSWAAWTSTAKTKVRIGKITGVTSVANEYGLIAGDTGFGQNDKWIKVSNLGVQMNNIPLYFFNGANWTGYWNATGTSFWIGTNNTDKRLEWNGSTLNIVGTITVTGGNAATQTYASTAASTAETNAKAYGDTTFPTKNLGNTSVNWALGATKGGDAYDTARVSGVAASTVKDYANRAGLGLNSAGRVALTIQAVSIPNDTAATGLNLTKNYMGYYNGTSWTMYMKSNGHFYFGGEGGNRLEWNGTQLAGYNAGSIQWYADASDGYLYAGGGYVQMGSFGIIAGTYTLLNSTGLTNTRPSIVYTYTIEPNGPLDTGTYPSAANSIDLKDTSFTASDWYGNSYSYTGQSLLRIYTSGKHFVSDDTYFDSDVWYHYLDGVVEVPPLSHPARTINPPTKPPPYDVMGQNVSDVYTPRLILRNVYSSIAIHRTQRIDINAQTTTFNYLSNNYTAPQDTGVSVELQLTTSGNTFTSSKTFNFVSQTNTMFLTSSNITIGNSGALGSLNLYGSTYVWQSGAALRLKAASVGSNQIYVEMYANASSPNTRSAWFGYGSNNTTVLTFSNELGSIINFVAVDKVSVSNNLAAVGYLRTDARLILKAVASVPPSEASYGQLYVNAINQLVYMKPGGALVVLA